MDVLTKEMLEIIRPLKETQAALTKTQGERLLCLFLQLKEVFEAATLNRLYDNVFVATYRTWLLELPSIAAQGIGFSSLSKSLLKFAEEVTNNRMQRIQFASNCTGLCNVCSV